MTRTPRALTIAQPWASLILAHGVTVVNRTWSTRYRGPLVIHAGNGWDQAGALAAADLGARHLLEPGDVPRGYLGVVHLSGCHPARLCCHPHGQQTAPPGKTMHHWTLTNPHPFDRPVLGRGSRGLYTPPATVLAHLEGGTP